LNVLPEDTSVNPLYRVKSSKSRSARDDDSESAEKIDNLVAAAAAANASNRGGSYNIQLVGMPSRHIEEKYASTTFSIADMARVGSLGNYRVAQVVDARSRNYLHLYN
jgi:hypothetical protein